MSRTRMLIAVALATAVAGMAAPAADAGQRTQMVKAINYARAMAHQKRLRFSKRLSGGASAWARSLMRRNVFAHSAAAMCRHEGEVIEWHTGGRAAIAAVVSEWLDSPPHRALMLARGYRHVGAGKAVGWMNGTRSTIWVVRFAR